MQKNFILLIALSAIVCMTKATDIDTFFFQQEEARLIELHQQIGQKRGLEKKDAEIKFRNALISTLQHSESDAYTFDSLKSIGRILSEDEKLIVFTWNIPQTGGFHNYYCLMQYYHKQEKSYKVVALEDQPGYLTKYPQAPAATDRWAGALYYKVIGNKYKGQVYYTLIGFDFNNLLSNRKVIEVISLDDNNNLIFPTDKFFYEGKPYTRMVFEYAERVQMVIDYNEKDEMIVVDHLSPFKPSLEGQYQFYGPDLSYDGFLFENGVWKHQKDITPIP